MILIWGNPCKCASSWIDFSVGGCTSPQSGCTSCSGSMRCAVHDSTCTGATISGTVANIFPGSMACSASTEVSTECDKASFPPTLLCPNQLGAGVTTTAKPVVTSMFSFQ